MQINLQRRTITRSQAFTIVEVVVAAAVALIGISATVYGYRMSSRRAEWAGYSAAAQAAAQQVMERVRVAKWDPTAAIPVDEMITANFPTYSVLMDLPVVGNAGVYAQNTITISTISTVPPVKMIRVDCTWTFDGNSYVNTLVTYRGPES